MINLKYQLQRRMRNLNCLMASYSKSYNQNYFKYIIKKQEVVMDNPPIRIYVNQIQIKTRYYIELLTP